MRKKAVVCVLLCLLLAGAGGGAYWYLHYGTGQGSQKERPPLPEGMEDTGQIVAATGTTSTGVVEKELDFNFLDADLIVDELYVSSSDTVEAGDKILKITENSLKEATRELERAKMDASLAYRQGKLDYQSGLLDAENSLKKSQIAAQSAQTVYDDAVAQAQADVTKAQQEVTDAQELVTEYTQAIEDDYYYTEYEVAEKKAAYEKNVKLFFEKLDDYGYELDDDDDDDPNTFNIVKKDSKGGSGQGNEQSKDGESTVLSFLKSEYQENKEEYDQALKDYEAATEKAKAGILAALADLQLKQLALQEAQIALEKATVSAQADYDTSIMEGQKAQAAYETEKTRLKEALDILDDAREEAQTHYDSFMETLGDGYFYAESAGTILMVRATENVELSKDGILMAYSDADMIQVTASVDQSDIAQIAIGDTAAVVMEDYDTYTGVVTQINPVTASESRASVSYSVILTLDGDVDALSANITANVYFGMTGAEYERKAAGREEEMKEKEREKPEKEDDFHNDGGAAFADGGSDLHSMD